jgi:hypothetical protein
MMRYFGLALYLALIISFMQNVLWLAFIILVAFSLRYGGVMVIPLAIALDGYYGNFYTTPYLSLLAVWWYLLIDYLLPRLASIGIINSDSWHS